MVMKKMEILAGILTLIVMCVSGSVRAQENVDFDKVVIKTTKVTDGIYVLEGSGGNITVFTGPEGALLVDSQSSQLYDKIAEAVAKISNQPIRFLIDSHFHGDHTGGNEAMSKHGVVVFAHENVRKRLSEGRAASGATPAIAPSPKEALPLVTFKDGITIHLNGEEISVIHPGLATIDGDSFVYFRRANVISVGDLPGALRYVAADATAQGTIDRQIVAAKQILNTANPDTKIVPGHGAPVITTKDARDHYDMLVAVRDRVMASIREGKTLDQVVASKPTADFDERHKGGPAPDGFVKGVYADLSRQVR